MQGREQEKEGLQRLIKKLTIVNVVATAESKQVVDLAKTFHVSGFRYDPEIYQCAYLKDRNTKGKVSIFSTGKMISIGTKSYKDSKHDLNYAAKRLSELGLVTGARINAKLQNIVAIGDTGHALDIERLSYKLPNIIYEPEQFPGAIYHAKELEGASILMFASGKVVFTGLKSPELLEMGEKLLTDLARMI